MQLENLSPGKLSDQIEKDLILSGNKIGTKRDVDDNHKSTSEVELVGFGIHSVNDEDSTSSERYSDTHVRMETEIIAKYEIENDKESEFHLGSDPDDVHSPISDKETYHKSEEEWFSSFNVVRSQFHCFRSILRVTSFILLL